MDLQDPDGIVPEPAGQRTTNRTLGRDEANGAPKNAVPAKKTCMQIGEIFFPLGKNSSLCAVKRYNQRGLQA
jgi:hypothetical protein